MKPVFSGNYNDLKNKPELFSGDYNDLSNKPVIKTTDESFSPDLDTDHSYDGDVETDLEYDTGDFPYGVLMGYRGEGALSLTPMTKTSGYTRLDNASVSSGVIWATYSGHIFPDNEVLCIDFGEVKDLHSLVVRLYAQPYSIWSDYCDVYGSNNLIDPNAIDANDVFVKKMGPNDTWYTVIAPTSPYVNVITGSEYRYLKFVVKANYGFSIRDIYVLDYGSYFKYGDIDFSNNKQILRMSTGTGNSAIAKGFIRDDSWDFIPNRKIYVNSAKQLVQEVPTGIYQEIGYAYSADIMWFEPQALSNNGLLAANSPITTISGMTATTIQEALAELYGLIGA